MNISHIFLDLDECLVSTIWKHNGSTPKNRTKIVLRNDWSSKDEVYWSVLRPGALSFLEYCRSIAPTSILTAAATDYAQEHNKIHGLGFSDDQIIGRDFYSYYKSGMFHDRVIATKENYAPDSILVDNQSIKQYGSENLRVKMTFLGIKEDRLVKSREYTGGNQPPDFKKEIDQIKKILEDGSSIK
jgi:hypothetical protein